MKKNRILLIVSVLLIAVAYPCLSHGQVRGAQSATSAEWGASMLHGLKATYKITVVIAAYQQVYEKNVTAMEAHGRFLVLRQKGKGNRDFRLVIKETNVIMIREGEGEGVHGRRITCRSTFAASNALISASASIQPLSQRPAL